ncbi:TPR repeat-containing thioredoxin TTL4-like [Camellia sinensis]|uniref:TPR repeat-containing thioredoxin TTL4-like n=1 Tax=Camellia sinensis TaxID=4442 RepID=UPI001036393C|nr:TPR repeat-containing thioredoxin TTL4-like [Camellia sinensis]
MNISALLSISSSDTQLDVLESVPPRPLPPPRLEDPGETEKAMYHYKQAGAESDPDVLTKAINLQVRLNKCTEAKMQRDWNTLLKETRLAISAGADSAPQIFALQAEALLKLYRLQEADEALTKEPNFDIDDCTQFFGPIGHASLLVC